ncbi:MAG: M56 family metallopeptidase, partial [Planctomycetes bacterium]|nr:M56 family metallopeptidase [Planctomycetota bacterium]
MSSILVYRLSDYLVQQSWQIAVLILLVALLNQALRNKSAHIRSMLWLIVLAKCLVPPMFSIPLAVLPTKAVEQLVVQESESSFSVLADEVPADPPTEVSSSIAPALTWVDRFQSYVQGHSMILLWALVVAAFYGIVLIRALRIRSRLYRDRQLAPPQLQAELESISKRMGRSKCPQAWLIGDVGQPFVWGWCKGTVYLPQDFFELNSAEFRQAILAHELSHMHRLDPGVNLIQLIAQGLFWFHPLVWWANSQLRQEREKCCDERVLAHLGIATRDYCQALIDTLARASRVTAPLGSLAISGPVKHVESRIQTMMNAKRRFAKGPKRLATITTAVLALFVVPMTFALTEKPIEENQSESTPIGFDRDRILSAENMKRLGPIIWELVDGQDQVLVHIEQLREHCPEDLFRWARESVRLNRELLRKPILGSVLDPIPVVAYDHDLMKQGRGTNALYLDLHV